MTLKKRKEKIEFNCHKSKLTTFFLVLLIVFGIIINFFYLNKGMGYDDIWNYETAVAPISKIYDAAPPSRTPLYFVFLKIWIAAFGNQEYVLKLFQVLLGIIFVIFMYKLGKRIHSKEAGLLAAAISSISPVLLHQTHQLDVYLMLMLFCLIGFYFLERYLRERKRIHILLFIAFSFLAILTRLSGILFLIIEIFYIFFTASKNKVKISLLSILPLIAAFPFLLKSINLFLSQKAVILSSPGKEIISFMPYPEWNLFLLAILVVGIYGLVINRKKSILLFLIGIVPIGFALVFSGIIKITYEPLIFSFIFLFLYAALSISNMNNKAKVISLIVIIAFSLYANWAYLSTLPDYGWKEASFKVNGMLSNRDIVVGSCFAERPLRYYANLSILSLYNISILPDKLRESASVFVVYSPDWDCMWDIRKTEVENSLSYIDENCRLTDKDSIKEVVILHYKCNSLA